MNGKTVLTGYGRLKDHDLEAQADVVNNDLPGNPNFQFDAAKVTDFQTNLTNFSAALKNCKNGTSADVLKKNVARKALLASMKYLAVEVNQQADGDTLILQSSGFVLSKVSTKIGPLPKPVDFKVQTGRNSGELLFDVDANANCLVYVFYFAPMPTTLSPVEMSKAVSTTHKVNVGNFTPGTQYKCYCAYQGTDPTLVYSEPIYIYAQ